MTEKPRTSHIDSRSVLTRRRPRCRLRRLVVRIVTASALVSLLLPAAVRAADDRVDEYQVKAAFLFNFAKFVTWPEGHGSRPLLVGIVGDDPFGPMIDDLVRGKRVGGREVRIERFKHDDDLRRCDIVFLSASEERRTLDILTHTRTTGVLTVGETPHFLREGGLVRFYVEGNRVRFQIDSKRADQAGVRISSQLLILAK